MFKKIIIAIMVLVTVFTLAACSSSQSYEFGPVSGGASASDSVSNNGKFLVEKGDYIYYINTLVSTSAENNFNSDSVSGIIVRSKKDGSDKTVVFPKIVANKSKTGLYIFDDRIYFTSPADSIDSKGEVQNTLMDVMSVKLDGTDAKKHVTLSSLSYELSFMQSNGTVYAVWANGDVLNRFNLGSDKSKTEVIVEGFSSKVYVGNEIYFAKPAYIDEKNNLQDRYSEVFKMYPDGEPTKVFDGNSNSNIKFKINLLKVENGKIFYTKEDSVVTLSNSLYVCDTNGGNEKKISTQTVSANNVVAYQDGYIISNSVGTAFIKNDGSLKQIISGTINIEFMIGDYLYYTSTSSSKASLYRYDMTKVLASSERVLPTQVLMYEQGSTAEDASDDEKKNKYDTADFSNFINFVVIGNDIYYYTAVQKPTASLYKWNSETQEFAKASLEK